MLWIIELKHRKIAANFCIQYDPEGQMFEKYVYTYLDFYIVLKQ